MKKLLLAFLTVLLFLAVATPVHATFTTLKQVCELNSHHTYSWGLRSTIPVGGFLYAGPNSDSAVVRNAWCNSHIPASPSPTPTATASVAPSPTTTPEATIEPTVSPTASASADPSASPSSDPVVVSTGGSDGRSDGRTDSLGCQHPSDNCNTQQGAIVAGVRSLPATGGTELLAMMSGLFVAGFVAGVGTVLSFASENTLALITKKLKNIKFLSRI